MLKLTKRPICQITKCQMSLLLCYFPYLSFPILFSFLFFCTTDFHHTRIEVLQNGIHTKLLSFFMSVSLGRGYLRQLRGFIFQIIRVLLSATVWYLNVGRFMSQSGIWARNSSCCKFFSTKVRSFQVTSCPILIPFKIVDIFNTTSADVILKMTMILKEMRIAQRSS